MVKHAACCYTRFSKDGGNKKPFFRVTGTDCAGHIHELGEVAMAHRGSQQHKSELKSFKSVWVGVPEGNGWNRVLTDKGALRARCTH